MSINNKYLAPLVLFLIICVGYLLFKDQRKSDLKLEQKCFSWSVYNPSVSAWRWRAEHLNEYFPTRETTIENCVNMLGGYTN